MDWISHDDRTLKEHLAGLKQVVNFVLKEKTQTFFSANELQNKVYSLISYHDLAKASIYFQLFLANALVIKECGHKYFDFNQLKEFINLNNEKFNLWKKNPTLKSHALLGAWNVFALCGGETKWELDSLLFHKIIKRHHGYLRDFSAGGLNPKDDKENLIEIANNINFDLYRNLCQDLGLPFERIEISELLNSFPIRKIGQIEEFLKTNKDASFYFKTLFLYSLLLSADKGDVMLKEKSFVRALIDSGVVDNFKSKTLTINFSINTLREEAYSIAVERAKELAGNNFFSITLPTGLGKTFTAYKVALEIKDLFNPDFRIVYCLPFTSIIDQNASIFKSILNHADIPSENIGIHHHLSIPEIKLNDDDSSYPEWEYFTEGWQNEITITTFVQLWESLFACHNNQIRKFHNLANSIIILDEIQSINPALFPALEFVMENMAKYFNTKFILVTATQPIILSSKIKELCFKDSDDYFFSKMNRIILNTQLLKNEKTTEEELSEIVLRDYRSGQKSILVICNTIRFSQNLYNLIAEELGDENIYYLSAAIIPHSREQLLENEIKIKLSEDRPIILISTQVVEAGVDIDFDTVYRDFAPLSSINQAAGRCNRNSRKKISPVFLFRSGKERIYDPTQLDITSKILNEFGAEIYENQFYDLNKKYFTAIKLKIQENSDVSQHLIKSILSLKFEDVGTNKEYRLIDEKYKSYSFFIPINNEAEILWNKYLNVLSIEEHFKRKTEIKLLMPHLMKYVVRIPHYAYSPNREDLDKAIINDSDWSDFYDEKFGYRKPENESKIEVW
jgi:CRISPR-associated endonuclease/helicase Cas3